MAANMLAGLQRLSVRSKIQRELDNHLGEDERHRDLADFFIETVHAAAGYKEFRRAVREDEDEDPLPEDLLRNLYSTVTRMLPPEGIGVGAGGAVAAAGGGGPVKRRRASPEEPPRTRRRASPGGAALPPPTGTAGRRGASLGRSVAEREARAAAAGGGAPPPFPCDDPELRAQKCEQVMVYAIYEGIVKNVREYGPFVELVSTVPEGWRVSGKKEGLCHISTVPGGKGGKDCRDFIKRGQKVFVKVMGYVEGKRISLNMNEVDQETGNDLRPRNLADRNAILERTRLSGKGGQHENLSGLRLREEDLLKPGRKRRGLQDLTGDEQFERQQMMKAVGWGAGVTLRDDPLWDDETGVMLEPNEDEQDIEIELNEQEPVFLQGQTAKTTLALSPVKLVKNMDSALAKAADNGRSLAKERRELRDETTRQEMGAIPRDLGRQWEDSMPGQPRILSGQLYHMLSDKGEQEPEWKLNAMKGETSFGKISTASLMEQRMSLPIYGLKEQLVNAVKEHRCLVVIGETGSGKTTQMTQYLVEAGFLKDGRKRIGCTQPRRVAATSVAKRVAEEYGCRVGEEVGYAIRFEDVTSPQTKIKYMTDGMLLRESLLDPELPNYAVIILDEAHERTVNTDVLFGLMKQLSDRRPDLRLIVTSATLDAEKFSTYFHNAPILTIPGRCHPVETLFANDDEPDYLDAALICAMQIHVEEPPGDILLFLTGQEEIDTAGETLHGYMKKLGKNVPELVILPAYASLPNELQSRIFDATPPGKRKIVIATNIAEASITIDGIYYVIDPGLSKQKRYNPKLGMDSLDVAPISQASAKQRAGRAGRTGPGKCYRLYTEDEYLNNMLPMTVPEIQRTNLANTVLTLKAMGIPDLLAFPFMDAPPSQTLVMALESLFALGALDDEGLLTRLGRRMAEFPLEPQFSKVLLTAVDFGCADDIATIAAMLQIQGVWYRPKDKAAQADQKKSKFHQPEGDHLTLLTVYEAWKASNFSTPWCYENFLQARSLKRAQDVRQQLVLILEKHKHPVLSAGKNYNAIRKAITSGFFFHACKRDPQEGYRTLCEEQIVYIHPSSSLFQKNPEWIVYHELVLTTKEYMREAMAIDPLWLTELAPNFFQQHDPRKLSKKKLREKVEPLYNKWQLPNEWRLSRAMRQHQRQRR